MNPVLESPPPIAEYTLLRSIGRGAYGEVWLARSVTGVYRAVKVVQRASFGEDRPFEREFAGIQRFEAVSVGQESQVALLHVGRNAAAGFFYYVMELADDLETGEEIVPERYVAKTLKELRADGRRLAASEALDIGLALTRALAHLHAHGLVHRDIKPSNVIFVHGVPKLADIGLVSAIGSSHSYVGTEGFVPPEGPGTAAADVFALGKVLYEISTGQDRKEYPKLPEGLEQLADRRALLELNEIVLKACDPELERRYPSAQSMRDDLLLLQAGRSVRRLHVMERRFAILAKYGIAATIVTALAIAGGLWAAGQTRQTRENLQRAERAEADAVARLHQANLNWVRANRLTGQPGQRFTSLAELTRAAALTNSLDLRNEAIACLALPDLRPLKHWAKAPDRDPFVFSPSGRLYFTHDDQGNLTARDTLTDDVRYRLPAPDQGARITVALISSDERFLATSDLDGHAQLWDWTASTAVRLEIPRDATLLTFTPDDGALVVGYPDHSLHFLAVPNGRQRHAIPGPAQVRWIRFNPTGEMFLTVVDGQALIHRTADGQRVQTLNAPVGARGGIRHGAWHPDGRRVGLVWMDHLGVWEVATGRQLAVFEGHEGTMVDLVFTETGEWLISTSWDHTTRLWHTDTHRQVLRLPESGNGVCLSVDGSRLAWNSWDHGRVHLYELALPKVVQRLTAPPPMHHADHFTAQVVFSPDGELVAAVDKEGVYLFQPPYPAPLTRLPVDAAYTAHFQRDGRALLTSGPDGVRRWPVAWSTDHSELRLGPPDLLEPTRGQPIDLFAVSRDGRWMVAATPAAFLGFDPEHPAEIIRTEPKILTDSRPHLSPDGRLAASHGVSGAAGIQIWNPRTGLVVTTLPARRVYDLAFSPDGRWLAAAAEDATVFWRTADWSPQHRILQTPEAPGRCRLAFSPDGLVAAISFADRKVRMVVVETGEELATLPTGRLVTSLAFSPGGDRLAVALEPGYFELWNLRQLREELAAMSLDWTALPLPPGPRPGKASRLVVLPDGSLLPASHAE